MSPIHLAIDQLLAEDRLPENFAALKESGWRAVSEYPRGGVPKIVRVKMADGSEHEAAHWAQGGGEDQPYFEGWFVAAGNYFQGIDTPVAWMPKEGGLR